MMQESDDTQKRAEQRLKMLKRRKILSELEGMSDSRPDPFVEKVQQALEFERSTKAKRKVDEQLKGPSKPHPSAESTEASFELDIQRALEADCENERKRMQGKADKKDLAQVKAIEQMRKIVQDLDEGDSDSEEVSTTTIPATNPSAKKPSSLGQKQPRSKLQLPLKFDWNQGVLISANRIASPAIPLKLAHVLRGWFHKNPLNAMSYAPLTYEQVATLYLSGRFTELAPDISKEEIQARLENHSLVTNARRIAHQFARDFTRWLKQMDVAPETVFHCDRKSQSYCLVSSGWHAKRPVAGHSEVTIHFRGKVAAKFRTKTDGKLLGDGCNADDAGDSE